MEVFSKKRKEQFKIELYECTIKYSTILIGYMIKTKDNMYCLSEYGLADINNKIIYKLNEVDNIEINNIVEFLFEHQEYQIDKIYCDIIDEILLSVDSGFNFDYDDAFKHLRETVDVMVELKEIPTRDRLISVLMAYKEDL